jgi:hypothetical protein
MINMGTAQENHCARRTTLRTLPSLSTHLHIFRRGHLHPSLWSRHLIVASPASGHLDWSQCLFTSTYTMYPRLPCSNASLRTFSKLYVNPWDATSLSLSLSLSLYIYINHLFTSLSFSSIYLNYFYIYYSLFFFFFFFNFIYLLFY